MRLRNEHISVAAERRCWRPARHGSEYLKDRVEDDQVRYGIDHAIRDAVEAT